MADSTHPAPDAGLGRPISELRDSGLLWLINRVVFHPRGLALALHADSTGQMTRWSLLGDGSEAWSFPEDVDQAHFRNAEATLLAARPRSDAAPEPREPNAYEANKDLFEELDRETKAASAAMAADDMDAWATHAGRGAELYEEIAERLGWRVTPPRYDNEESGHA